MYCPQPCSEILDSTDGLRSSSSKNQKLEQEETEQKPFSPAAVVPPTKADAENSIVALFLTVTVCRGAWEVTGRLIL